MKTLLASAVAWGCAGLFAVAYAMAEAPEFDRYQVILSRMPFGPERALQSPGGATSAASGAPAESFTKNLKMCAVTRHVLTGQLQVGLVDIATKRNYFLKVGDEEDGIRLVDADYDKEKALLKKGDEQVWITMTSGAGFAVAAAPAGVPPAPGLVPAAVPSPIAPPPAIAAAAVPRVPALPQASGAPTPKGTPADAAAERLAAMRARRMETLAPAAVPSAHGANTRTAAASAASKDGEAARSPKELEKHLQDYQMDLIRSAGTKGPPLPIPLTPEMDQKLVDEGVLPPQ